MKPIKGYEDYFVTRTGDIYSKKSGCLKKLKYFDRKGYWATHLYRNGIATKKSIHRLVIETYKRNHQNKSQVNHIDGDTKNNHIDNLEWATASENGTHAYSKGLSRRVEWSGTPRRKVKQYTIEGDFVAEYVSVAEASRRSGIPETNIFRVMDGERKAAGKYAWKDYR